MQPVHVDCFKTDDDDDNDDADSFGGAVTNEFLGRNCISNLFML